MYTSAHAHTHTHTQKGKVDHKSGLLLLLASQLNDYNNIILLKLFKVTFIVAITLSEDVYSATTETSYEDNSYTQKV